MVPAGSGLGQSEIREVAPTIGHRNAFFPDFRIQTCRFFDLADEKPALAVKIGERFGVEIVVVEDRIVEQSPHQHGAQPAVAAILVVR